MSAKTLKMELELLVSWLLGKLIRVASFKGMFTSNFLFFFFRMQKLSKGIWSSVRLERTNCLSEATQTFFFLLYKLGTVEFPASAEGKEFCMARLCVFSPVNFIDGHYGTKRSLLSLTRSSAHVPSHPKRPCRVLWMFVCCMSTRMALRGIHDFCHQSDA